MIMSFLGHKNGPSMSVILERYKSELYKLTKDGAIGGPRVSPDVINHIIEEERGSEDRGIVIPVKVPYGHGVKEGELIYINYSHRIQFYYILTEAERAQLGSNFRSERVEILSPEETRRQRLIREEMMGRGEFPLFGDND